MLTTLADLAALVLVLALALAGLLAGFRKHSPEV